MGDRAVIHFVDEGREEVSPATYLHWGGHEVEELLRECFELMKSRGPDVGYTAARFIGICHARDPKSNMSLGTWNAPSLRKIRQRDGDRWSYGTGDAGVFLVHLSSAGWSIEMFGGYGFDSGGRYRDSVRRVDWRWQA